MTISYAHFAGICLAESGFAVLEGDNGLEALLVAANHDGAIEVLITDLEMPRISGFELAQVFKAMWPTIGVLYISGSLCACIRAGPDSDCVLLPKPFLPGALLQAHRRGSRCT